MACGWRFLIRSSCPRSWTGITAAWQSAARVFESLGAQVIPTRLPLWYFDLSVPAGRIIASEAYALHRDYVNDKTAQLCPAVRNRILAAEKFGPATTR